MFFHVSEEAGIERFEPRAVGGDESPKVWAVDEARLRNYLLPRECPRVTYYDGDATTDADRKRFLGSSEAVVAVESGWFGRISACRLYRYHLPPDTFYCVDENAGYYVSRESVSPQRVDFIDEIIPTLLDRGIELRLLPNLWDLHDAVAASSLRFFMIRTRNAQPRGGY